MAFSDLELLARLIQCEAGGEGDTGMAAVASVVMNRVQAPGGEYARVGQGSIRKIILQPGQFTPTQLSQILRVRPSTITPMLQRLEDQGLLCRIHSREDRRQVFLTITPEGRDFLEENRRRLLTFYRSLLARLGPEEAALFLDLLEKISDPLPPISLGPVPKKGCEPPC